jgi:hypothetical protein
VAQKKGHCTAIFSADEEEETRLSVLFTLLKRWFLSTISCGVVRCGGHNMLSMIFTALQSLARTRSEMMRPYADIMGTSTNPGIYGERTQAVAHCTAIFSAKEG